MNTEKVLREPHWCRGFHEKCSWDYLGSVQVHTFLDVYRHRDKKVYPGISMQFGSECWEYYATKYIYIDHPVNSFKDGILKSFAIRYGRITQKESNE